MGRGFRPGGCLTVKRFVLTAPVLLLALSGAACSYEHTSTLLSPTATTTTPASSASTASTSTVATPAAPTPAAGSTAQPAMTGLWSSAAAASLLPTPSSCGNFQYQITSQTATTVNGTFSATCGGGLTVTGSGSGVLNAAGTVIAVTASGVGTAPGIPTCAFTLSGDGTIEDNGNTLRLPFTGTTCLGPVSGTEVLRKAQSSPASVPASFEAPAPVSPGVNQLGVALRPTFTVTNAARTGTVGSVTYAIELATDEAFTTIVASWTAAEQSNQTALDCPKDLSYSKVYYWHVRATDGSVTGAWSRTLAFQVKDAPPPPAPVVTVSPDAIDLRQAIVTSRSPADVATWPVTTTITAMDFRSDGVSVQFSKKDGPGRWPDVVPPGWEGPLQYTLWMVVNVNGVWYTAGGVEYWYGLDRSGGPPSQYAANWYYSAGVWGPLATHQPRPGEQVGFFITAGDGRAKDVRSVTERSNVIMVPFPSDAGGRYP